MSRGATCGTRRQERPLRQARARGDAPGCPAEVNVDQGVAAETQLDERVETEEPIEAVELVAVELQLAHMPQDRELVDRVEVVAAQVEALEVDEVLERREAREAVRRDEERAQRLRDARQVRELVVVPVGVNGGGKGSAEARGE